MRIALFDITPVHDAVELGFLDNYWNATNMTQWVDEVVAVAREMEGETGEPMTCLLKPKRAYTDQHDRGYQAVLDWYVQTGRITLVDYQTNLYTLIQSVHWSLVVPYSSPAYVAASRCAPSSFYDATSTLVPTYEPSRWIRFVSGVDQLRTAWRVARDEAA